MHRLIKIVIILSGFFIGANAYSASTTSQEYYKGVSDHEVCIDATYKKHDGSRYWIECLECGYSGSPGIAALALKEAVDRGLSCGIVESTTQMVSKFPPCPSSGLKHKCFGRHSWEKDTSYLYANFLDGKFDGYTNVYSRGNVWRCTSTGGSCEGFAQVHVNYDGASEESGVEIYTGEVANTSFQGFGRYEWNNGSIYWGSWKSSFRDGMGALIDFSNQKNDGSGVMFYIGNFENDKKNGYGALFVDGRQMIGRFVDDRFEKRGDETEVRRIISAAMESTVAKFIAYQQKENTFPLYHYDEFLAAMPSKDLCILSGSKVGNLPFFEQANDRGLDCRPKAKFSPPNGYPKKVCAIFQKSRFFMEKNHIDLFFKTMKSDLERLGIICSGNKQPNQTIPANNTRTNDTQIPLITIASANTKGKQGVIRGKASDNVGVAEITVSGQTVPFDASGNFQYQTYVPTSGKDIVIEVTDVAGLTSKQTVSLTRSTGTSTAAIIFDSLNPLGRRVAMNNDALALIIGVDGYENTPARAIYADSDAQMFADYASEKLGIPDSRIKTMVNDGAGERELLLSVKSWLSRSVKQNQSDVYIFFAGHGLASDDGSKMYLLPYDGAPELLDDTAILRERLFNDIAAANPRSVTVFLDTCYSGTTRGTDMLIASRPIAIRALEQSIPDNFTVFTAAAGDQTAKPLEEAKHGMFSYFLMKGMEGEADTNMDNKITAHELHEFIYDNVVQQSSGSQTPELQGDAERVLVTFQ